MRFLKNRIAEARAFQAENQKKALILLAEAQREEKEQEQEPSTPTVSTSIGSPENIKKETGDSPAKRRRPLGSCYVPQASRETKNLVKNYGKAICNFSTSALALSYLRVFVENEGVTLNGFLQFVGKSKSKIDGLQHFREVLLTNENDTEQTSAYRRIYKQVGEVFIKYFSVNWIFHSKVKYKKAHLNFRYKMLRRIQSPELFTYLKGPRNCNMLEN